MTRRSSEPRGRAGALAWIAFAGFLSVPMSVPVEPLLRARAAAGWIETTCTIQRGYTEQRPSRGRGSSTTTRAGVEYAYSGGGMPRTATAIDFTDSRDADDAGIVGRRGAQLSCWYDPRHPERAVLERVGWVSRGFTWFLLALASALPALLAALIRRDGRGRLRSLPQATLAVFYAALAWLASGAGAPTVDVVVLALTSVALAAWTAAWYRRHR